MPGAGTGTKPAPTALASMLKSGVFSGRRWTGAPHDKDLSMAIFVQGYGLSGRRSDASHPEHARRAVFMADVRSAWKRLRFAAEQDPWQYATFGRPEDGMCLKDIRLAILEEWPVRIQAVQSPEARDGRC